MKSSTLLLGLLVSLLSLCGAQATIANTNVSLTTSKECANKTLTECKAIADSDFDMENYEGALALYSSLCQSDVPHACHRVAWMHQTQTGVTQNLKTAINYYQKACDLNHGQGCQNLAVIYEFWVETDTPVAKIVELYKKGCDLNNADACANLAINYSQGDGVEKDDDKYIVLTKKSCALDNDTACEDIGDHYDETGEMEMSLQYHLKACELNSAYGCQQSAWKYSEDLGDKLDFAKAHIYNTKACDLENGAACNNLGRVYIGYSDTPDPDVKIDKVKGLKLLVSACYDYEIASGCGAAGYAYDEGDGVDKDQALGHKLFVRGCDELEDPSSANCFNLGNSYQYGNDVVKKNKKKAQHYYNKSCELGSESGCDKLQSMVPGIVFLAACVQQLN